MNIAIVTTWFERGAAYVSRQYMNSLSGVHNVFIYARGGEKFAVHNKEWDLPNVTWGKRLPVSFPSALDLKDFKRWIKEKNIEIVFFNEQWWWEPVLFCVENGIKVGTYVDYYTEETIPFFGCYDFLVCNTKRHYSVFNWHPQCYYIPWGTDVEIFKPKSFNPVNPNMITFFHSSGFSPKRKGTDFVIKAFERIKNKAKLVIHSQVNIGKHFPELMPLINELIKSESLNYIEKEVSAPGLYHLGDVYLYPSRLDGIGLTIAEALACGLPAIVSNNPPMSEFATKDVGKLVNISTFYSRADGYYWPQCDVDLDSLSNAMQEYVDNFSNILNYKKSAREFTERALDWKKNSIGLSGIFSKIDKITNCSLNKILVNRIRYYEKSKIGLRNKLYLKYPYLFYLVKLFLRKE